MRIHNSMVARCAFTIFKELRILLFHSEYELKSQEPDIKNLERLVEAMSDRLQPNTKIPQQQNWMLKMEKIFRQMDAC